MTEENIDLLIIKLREAYLSFEEPVVTQVAKDNDPFKVLVSTILSLRTKDDTTKKASLRLFKQADTPEKLAALSEEEIKKLIYPVGFYKTKAENLKKIADILIKNYSSKVPDKLEDLLELPNVGRKTANLVLSKGYNKAAICVDVHVHRISNRLGLIKTRNPKETEFALMKILPEKYWIEYNDLLVPFGQNICRPVSPFCSRCPIDNFCDKVGVEQFR